MFRYVRDWLIQTFSGKYFLCRSHENIRKSELLWWLPRVFRGSIGLKLVKHSVEKHLVEVNSRKAGLMVWTLWKVTTKTPEQCTWCCSSVFLIFLIFFIFFALELFLLSANFKMYNRAQKSIKAGKDEKLYLFLYNSWPLVPIIFFWKGDWVVGSASTHFLVFHIISEFPKIPSLNRSAARQLLYNVFCTRFDVPLCLWWIKPH